MINLAVIEIKDIMKYLVRITIIITIVVSLTRYFSNFRTKVENSEIAAKEYTFLSCFDTVIPSIQNVNKKEKKENEVKIGPLKMALEVELGMMESLTNEKNDKEKQTEKEDKVEDEKVQEAKTGLKTQVQESNVPQKFTTTYNNVKIKNETEIKLTQDILKPEVKLNTKNILIYHTHTCESYTQSEKYTYKASR